VIHIAERDTQTPSVPKAVGEFVNTWSVDGFVSEGSQPAELGWGTHERALPADGRRHDFGRDSAIYLMRPGAGTKVRSWTPMEGHYHGFLITHGESISISDYLTHREGETVTYRPTVHYAYHPSDSAVLSVHEFAGRKHLHRQLAIRHFGDARGILLEHLRQCVEPCHALGDGAAAMRPPGRVRALHRPVDGGLVGLDDAIQRLAGQRRHQVECSVGRGSLDGLAVDP
jgi:hypothetical protein